MKLLKILGIVLFLLLPNALAVTVDINPETPTPDQSLTCDVSGSSNLFNFYWFEGGQERYSTTSAGSSTLSATLTDAGEEWTCKVYIPSNTFLPEQYLGEDSVVIQEIWAVPTAIPWPWAIPTPIPYPTVACNDGFDNDRDGKIDMDDFGCTSPTDTDEEFPQPLTQCSDNFDNDGDGLADLDDPGCSNQADDDE